MRGIPIVAMTLLALALALPGGAEAKNNKDRGGNGWCPPGLAKKNPPCVPPGQAKKRDTYRADRDDRRDRDHRGDRDRHNDWDYHVGDIIDRDYVILRRPETYGLDPYGSYYRLGDYVYRVDRDTRAVLQIIGALGVLLN